jgi:hypothetical protein
VTLGPLDTGTWRWERSCATWIFELSLPLPSSALASEAIGACARGALAALPGFAVPAVAEWTTESAGDDAAVQPRGTTIDEATVIETLRQHPDVIAFALELDLLVLVPDGITEETIEEGGGLHIELEPSGLVLWFSLNVDLYAAQSFGRRRNNERLALLNAPRLEAFLSRLVEATGARFHSVDAPSYAEQATQHGFES